MPTQVPVVVLSGSRTMFKNTIHVPVNGGDTAASSDEDIAAARAKLEQLKEDADTLSQLRRFFISVGIHAERTLAGYELPPNVAEHAS